MCISKFMLLILRKNKNRISSVESGSGSVFRILLRIRIYNTYLTPGSGNCWVCVGSEPGSEFGFGSDTLLAVFECRRLETYRPYVCIVCKIVCIAQLTKCSENYHTCCGGTRGGSLWSVPAPGCLLKRHAALSLWPAAPLSRSYTGLPSALPRLRSAW